LGVSEIKQKSLVLEVLKIVYKAGFGNRGFWGSNVADFLVRPSDRSILLDLLLEEISGIWGPSWLPMKKPEK